MTRFALWHAGVVARVRRAPELLAIVGLAVVLYGSGIGWGLPNVEDWAIDSISPLGPLQYAQRLLESGHWWSKYPPLHYTLLAAVYAPYVAFLAATGALDVHGAITEYPYGLARPEVALSVFTVLARLVSACMGVATAAVVYAIARELGGRRAGLFAGLLFVCSPLTIYYAHTGNLDVPYLFWSSLALLCLVRLVRHDAPPSTYVGAGVFTAAAIATKDQAYALFLLMPIPLLLLQVRCSGWRGAADRRLLAGFAASLLFYLVAANVLLDPAGWLAHLEYVTHDGSAPYRMFPATVAGYAALAQRTVRLVVEGFTGPAAVLGVCGALWMVARRVRGAGVLTLAAFSYVVLFLGPILYVLPRFVLPLVLVLAVFGGIAASALWQMRHALARMVVTMVIVSCAVYGATMNLGLLWDTRYAAERWLTVNLPARTLVGTEGEPIYLPRLPRDVATVAVRLTADGPVAASARTPEYLVLSDAHYRRHLRREPTRDALLRLLAGQLDYEPIAVFEQPHWLPATQLIPTVAPRIVILRRRPADDGDAVSAAPERLA